MHWKVIAGEIGSFPSNFTDECHELAEPWEGSVKFENDRFPCAAPGLGWWPRLPQAGNGSPRRSNAAVRDNRGHLNQPHPLRQMAPAIWPLAAWRTKSDGLPGSYRPSVAAAVVTVPSRLRAKPSCGSGNKVTRDARWGLR
jgi:hypothetical protein